jgi:hypothetical protein
VQVALATFDEYKDEMMAVARDMVSKDLHLSSSDD